jgi:ribosomal protein S18 acetylase RimI-like enzyme
MGALVITIRPAEWGDAAGIAAVHDAAWLEAYRGIIPGAHLQRMVEKRGPRWWQRSINARHAILVLQVGGTIAGYVTYGAHRRVGFPPRGEIFELYVEPTHQGLGFGTRLFKSAREHLARNGFNRLVVWALAENDRARGFYERLGGRAGARQRDRYGDRTVERVAFVWE